MMNALSDILCDTSSLMAPQSFKETLHQNKISHQDISSKQGPLLLNSVSQISNINTSLTSVNHSSPTNINIFNSSDQMHIPSNIDSGFEDRSNVSVFSDSFPEIVPSWLTNDFMKVSDNLPSPGILSNVSDIYATNRENEHLEMLDLGFTSELTSQDVVSNSINRNCIDDSQKLLADLPMQRFSTSESLIIPSFNDLSNTHLHLSMNKNDMQYQKFKQNESNVDSARSLMNAVLPCESDLLHLPLPSSLSEQCLNSTSSPSLMSNSQSQSHPVDVVCDKLPQINLNHLDSLLGNETTLPEIQLLRHDFPSVRLSGDGCNSHSNNTCLDSYNTNGSIMSCESSILGPTVPPLSQSQDVSVQVSVKMPAEPNLPGYGNCYSCNGISPELPIEIVQCFKCKFCDFVSIHKCAVANHINISHSKSTNPSSINENPTNNIRSDNMNSLSAGGQSETHFNNNNSLLGTNISPVLNTNVNNITLASEGNALKTQEKFPCIQCNIVFMDVNEFNSHLLSNHGNKFNPVQISSTDNSAVSYQIIPVNNIVINEPPKKDENFLMNNISNVLLIDSNKTSTLKSRPKKADESQKKNQPKKTVCDSTTTNNEKNLSSHKKAWQRKKIRELGSYICEFKGCNVRFHAFDNLEYHRKCHSSVGSAFQCPECRMDFDNWGVIAGHLWRNHGNDMELHACDQCPFRTYSLSRLENLHKRIHKDECLFLCDSCGKSFKNGKQLRNHRAIHLNGSKPKNVKKFSCNICSKGFSTKHLLVLHQSTVHNKIKPFMCSFCEYTASKKSSMNMHMRQHTGEKPFKCDICDYRTADHNSLRRHKMLHSGEKPYKCPYCSYSCIQASLIKTHMKKHPGGNEGLVFSCTVCSFKTINQETYTTHMSEHEIRNRPPDNSTSDMQSTDEIFPLAKAMDISLSNSDNLLNNKNKNIQSFFSGLNVNMVSFGQQSVS